MDQSDIIELKNILVEASLDKDWDKIEEAKEFLKEFLDNHNKDEYEDDEII